ncbi:uncharacterized protein LOC62_07G009588 [Vanrija pseudolonga]|uniref:Uncharacterized protein n=1 Tax=Vanrija pseudolonga TaxID=143232 RepID=A0AAF1BRP4_9TREE|nr:hypothetical protein LOC62_07G009588 [Vanrija pseudolonga]
MSASAAATTTTTSPAVLLDHSWFPELIDKIAAHSTRETLYTLRRVSRGLKATADTLLSHDLVLEGVGGVIRASTPKRPLEQCSSADGFSDRLPLQGAIPHLVEHSNTLTLVGMGFFDPRAANDVEAAIGHSRIARVVLFPGKCHRYHDHAVPAPRATELAIHAGFCPLRGSFSGRTAPIGVSFPRILVSRAVRTVRLCVRVATQPHDSVFYAPRIALPFHSAHETADTRLHVVFVDGAPTHEAAFRTVWFNQHWLHDLVYAFRDSSEIQLVDFAKAAGLFTYDAHDTGTVSFSEEFQRGWFRHLLDVHGWSVGDALRDTTLRRVRFA